MGINGSSEGVVQSAETGVSDLNRVSHIRRAIDLRDLEGLSVYGERARKELLATLERITSEIRGSDLSEAQHLLTAAMDRISSLDPRSLKPKGWFSSAKSAARKYRTAFTPQAEAIRSLLDELKERRERLLLKADAVGTYHDLGRAGISELDAYRAAATQTLSSLTAVRKAPVPPKETPRVIETPASPFAHAPVSTGMTLTPPQGDHAAPQPQDSTPRGHALSPQKVAPENAVDVYAWRTIADVFLPKSDTPPPAAPRDGVAKVLPFPTEKQALSIDPRAELSSPPADGYAPAFPGLSPQITPPENSLSPQARAHLTDRLSLLERLREPALNHLPFVRSIQAVDVQMAETLKTCEAALSHWLLETSALLGFDLPKSKQNQMRPDIAGVLAARNRVLDCLEPSHKQLIEAKTKRDQHEEAVLAHSSRIAHTPASGHTQ